MRNPNFDMRTVEIRGWEHPYDPEQETTTAPWRRWILLLVGVAMITSLALTWII